MILPTLAILLQCCISIASSSSLSFNNIKYSDLSPTLPLDLAMWDTTSHDYSTRKDHYLVELTPPGEVTRRHLISWLDAHHHDVHHVPPHAFLVFATPKVILESIPTAHLKSMREFHPRLRVAERNTMSKCQSGKVDVLVSGLASSSPKHLQHVADEIVSLIAQRLKRDVIHKVSTHHGRQKIRLHLKKMHMSQYDGYPTVLTVLQHIPNIRWIECVPTFLPQNKIATWTIQSSSDANQHPIWDRNLTGMGMLVHLGDTGLDYDSCYFRDPSQDVVFYPQTNPKHRKVLTYQECVDDSEKREHEDREGAHGTHVSGSFVGLALSSEDSSKSDYNGMAKDAKLFFTDLTCGPDDSLIVPDDMRDYYTPAYELGARVSSNSWGSDESPKSYIAVDRETDMFLYERQNSIAVFAAGNSPSAGILSPAASKNSLTVGAHINSADASQRDTLASFSAPGPTFDNRVKPEVVGPGQYVTSSRSDGDLASNQCELESKGGTSMATPHIAGSTVLSRQYFVEGYYPSGTRNPKDSLTPSGSMMKAFMIHSATPLASVDGGFVPSDRQGWGKVVLNSILYFADSGKQNHLYIINNQTIHQHEIYSTCIEIRTDVASAVQDLRATLTWFDPPTAPEGAAQSVINDLDLVIVDASGKLFYSNNLDGFQWHDIVEQVTIPRVPSGTYRVMVYGTSVPEYGPFGGQPFSVVISGPGIQQVDPAVCGNTHKCPKQCSNHGVCQAGGVCACDATHHHVDCSKCDPIVICNSNGACDDITSKCSCGAHFIGSKCGTCASGWYGPQCDGDCQCGSHGGCNETSGRCSCTDSDTEGHYGGIHCEKCKFDWRGPECTLPSYWCRNREVRELRNKTGWIQISGDPKYLNSQICSWKIVADPSWIIKLTFVKFVVEDTYDWVKIYDGDSPSAPLLHKLTGHMTDLAPIQSKSNSLFIQFQSDLVGDDEGFDISYAVISPCNAKTCHSHGHCNEKNVCTCDEGWDEDSNCKYRNLPPATTREGETPSPQSHTDTTSSTSDPQPTATGGEQRGKNGTTGDSNTDTWVIIAVVFGVSVVVGIAVGYLYRRKRYALVDTSDRMRPSNPNGVIDNPTVDVHTTDLISAEEEMDTEGLTVVLPS